MSDLLALGAAGVRVTLAGGRGRCALAVGMARSGDELMSIAQPGRKPNPRS